MFIFLVYLLFLISIFKIKLSKNLTELVVCTTLVFSVTVVCVTEILNLFNCINLLNIALFWSVISIVLLYFLIKKKNRTLDAIKILNVKIYTSFISLKIYKKGILFFMVFFLLLLLLQGLIYPPNNWDSLTYHMSRIMYWLGNENLNHFPTHILRHLYQPPFAEYIIMHVNVLQGNDYFSNSIQLLFLVFSLFPLNEILNYLKVNKTAKLLSFLFCITIPSVILQATTTKNDIVCAFFILTSIMFLYKSYKEPSIWNYFFLGLSIGLGMLTKGTFYLFIFPALLIFLFFIVKQLLYEKKFKPILYGSLSIFMLLLINVGHFSRNYSINNHILSIDDVENKM
jgi:hypothetical protein